MQKQKLTLKAQLRANIIKEIQAHITDSEPQTSLFIKALNSLVVEYLQSRGNEFTLSVFLPESGLGSLSGVN